MCNDQAVLIESVNLKHNKLFSSRRRNKNREKLKGMIKSLLLFSSFFHLRIWYVRRHLLSGEDDLLNFLQHIIINTMSNNL